MVLFPKALRRGDTVALVSPAGPLPDRASIEPGLDRLRAWGLEAKLMPHCLEQNGYLAGTDDERARDLQAAIEDPDCRAIVCTRGGYGAMRILDRLDLAPLRDDPKPLLGYSDITALLAATFAEIGLVGLHGPMMRAKSLDRAQVQLQRDLLFETEQATRLPRGDDAPNAHTITPGKAEGELVGGNLSIVASLVGTPWQIRTGGRILFLEDVDEAPYRVDRMLTQMRLAKQLDGVAGILLGDFHAERTGAREFERVFTDRLGDLGVPVTYGWPFGHIAQSWTLPFGVRARLHAPSQSARPRLELLGPAVTR